MFVDLDLALRHLKADKGPEDDLVTLYLSAAEQAAIDYLNRQVYATPDDMAEAVLAGDAGDDPILVNNAIRAAILLTLGHLYTHREDVVAGVSAVELPLGARSLLRPHRRVNGV